MCVLAVDLGGTKINVGIVNPDLTIQKYETYATDTSNQSVAVDALIASIDDFIEGNKEMSFSAISVCVVGRVDSEQGKWIDIDPGRQHETNLRDILEERFKTKVFVLNDVNASAYAEMKQGVGKSRSNFVYYNIGTGIAIGIVRDGKLVIGSHFDIGEIGHSVYKYYKETNTFTTIEEVASGLGMSQQVKEKGLLYPDSILDVSKKRIDFQEIEAAFLMKDKLAEDVISEAVAAISTTFVNIARYIDPDCIVLGGGVINSDVFFDTLLRNLPQKGLRFIRDRIYRTELDNRAIGLIGCAAFAYDYEGRD